jgi:cytosine/adenosine deaminase-related metal-dependent hydrolase
MRVSLDQACASETNPTRRRRLLADAAVDAMGTSVAPVAIVVDKGRIEAIGTPQSIGPVADALTIDCSGHVLLPGLVNAHAHLDLSGPGPWAPQSDFRAWVGRVRALRALQTDDDRSAAVRKGLMLSRAGGTVALGDIIGQPHASGLGVLQGDAMYTVGFCETFGLGDDQANAVSSLQRIAEGTASTGRFQLGLSPHAPSSCGLDVFAAAADLPLPMCTHLAETPDEVELLQHGTGALADLIVQDVGLPADALPVCGLHPVDAVHTWLQGVLCVHVNCIDEGHAQSLARVGAIAVLCPRATKYFDRALPGPYHVLRQAGVPLVLGTDALLCLDTPERISTLDEARLLFANGVDDASTLLDMITVSGARALGIDPSLVSLLPGPCAGVLALPLSSPPRTADAALAAVLRSASAPIWAMGPA